MRLGQRLVLIENGRGLGFGQAQGVGEAEARITCGAVVFLPLFFGIWSCSGVESGAFIGWCPVRIVVKFGLASAYSR